MFTYLNPEIRQRLIADEKLVRMNQEGVLIDVHAPEAPGALAINLLGPIPMPIALPSIEVTVKWYAAVRSTELSQVEDLAADLRARGGEQLFSHLVSPLAVNSVLVIGEPTSNPLIRVHSNCLTGDVFGSQRCDCGPQLDAAIARINGDAAGGYLIYMAGHEGRGIGLWAKAATYLLQDGGEDTYQANRSLGLPDDSRDFTDAAALIKHFIGLNPFRLLTNNPKKIDDLKSFGLDGITQEKHVTGVSQWNRRYLHAKQNWGHRLEDSDIER
ncbi:MAG: GTP cyclohydrolase II [Gammaproteobacteria bacterium]|jgi:GTP cyclohydrolase II|nr:GTP cyclohydrolase II [Gammaproteobacteria bacterium]MCH1550910.1 GTP cyclohydrolase II [Pseudomonadales bacterium]